MRPESDSEALQNNFRFFAGDLDIPDLGVHAFWHGNGDRDIIRPGHLGVFAQADRVAEGFGAGRNCDGRGGSGGAADRINATTQAVAGRNLPVGLMRISRGEFRVQLKSLGRSVLHRAHDQPVAGLEIGEEHVCKVGLHRNRRVDEALVFGEGHPQVRVFDAEVLKLTSSDLKHAVRGFTIGAGDLVSCRRNRYDCPRCDEASKQTVVGQRSAS